jgi:DNA-directed RNA polymerase subunit RPC12/RpoP
VFEDDDNRERCPWCGEVAELDCEAKGPNGVGIIYICWECWQDGEDA